MAMVIVICAVVLAMVLLGIVFVTGLVVGVGSEGESARERAMNARLRAMEAERRLHNLTRETFIRLSEAAEQRRQHG